MNLAYCGINCRDCPAYQGTVAGDPELLAKAATTYGGPDGRPEEWVCLGCGPHNRDILSQYCSGCAIRLCAEDREVSSCAVCGEFEGCVKLRDFIQPEKDTPLARKMGLLRRRYLALRDGAGAAQAGG